MLRVGLTGGVASGKSEAATAFTRLGAPVADADFVAKELTAPGQPGLEQLVSALGDQILNKYGHLDRPKLRQWLFADAALRARVEAILHPLIVRRLKTVLDEFQTAYAIAVIPLLVETKSTRTLVDRVLVVDCPEPIQLTRLMSRDGITGAVARAILDAQASRPQRLAVGDDILMNSGNLNELSLGVARLHQFYLDLAEPARLQYVARPH